MKNKKPTAVLLTLTVLLSVCVFTFSSLAGSTDISTEGATVFTFSDSGITVENGNKDNYTVKGTALTVKASGTYVLNGTCGSGSINVKKGTKDVNLVLSGLNLTASDSTAALVCSKSTSVVIYAAASTVNTLADRENNNDELTATDGTDPLYPDAENAVIKCKDGSQVTLSGSGTLNVNAKGKNAIKSGATTEDEGTAYLTVKNLTLNIDATGSTTANDGINAEQTLNILSGNINVKANDDGIHSDLVMNIGEKGTTGPVINVEKSEEGIEASELYIYSGDITVNSNDDGLNAANSDLEHYSFLINISGGTLYINAANGDGIDSNGTLTISGGTVEVYASARGDNSPLDSDSTFSITGGTVFAVGNSQMAQTPVSGSRTCVIFGGGKQGGMFGMGAVNGISIKAGDALTVSDSKGNVLFEGKAERSADYVLFSSDELTENNEYTLNVNGKAVTSEKASAPDGSTFTPSGFNDPGKDNGRGFSSVFTRISDFFNRIISFLKSIFGIK